jgi:hypothetical protein
MERALAATKLVAFSDPVDVFWCSARWVSDLQLDGFHVALGT